jgi:predicted nucleotidyltransferase
MVCSSPHLRPISKGNVMAALSYYYKNLLLLENRKVETEHETHDIKPWLQLIRQLIAFFKV